MGTELRECKIRHSFVQDVAATVRQLLQAGKKIGFYHGPLHFDVSDFGAPTLLIEDADITIRAVVSPETDARCIHRSAELQRVNRLDSVSESAFVILSVAERGSAQGSGEGRQKQHSLREVVDGLYYRDVDEGDPVPICDESLTVGMLAIARNPTDAFRTFYTSDLDLMLIGNYLIEK